MSGYIYNRMRSAGRFRFGEQAMGFYNLSYSFCVVLQSQQHAYSVEEEILDTISAMRNNGGGIQELQLEFSSTDAVLDEDLCVGTGWLLLVSDTVTKISLKLESRACVWDDLLWERIALCQKLAKIQVTGDYDMSSGAQLQLPFLQSCTLHLHRIDQRGIEHLVSGHTQLERLNISADIGSFTELKIESSSLKELSMVCYEGKLVLDTPNLKILHLQMQGDSEVDPELVVLCAPLLKELYLHECEPHVAFDRLSGFGLALDRMCENLEVLDFRCATPYPLMVTVEALLCIFPQLEEIRLKESSITENEMNYDTVLEDASYISEYHLDRHVKVYLRRDPDEVTAEYGTKLGVIARGLRTLELAFPRWSWLAMLDQHL